MQGAVAGYIWVQNDPKYQRTEFGRNRAYWKSRLRAAAFAWAYSEQFEIGPISEATIGKIQARYPQQGYVDHVITPAVGLCWMMAEDAVDKYLITHIEEHTQNRWVRMFARAGLNPSRSMANAMRMEVPWHRDTRPGIWHDEPVLLAAGTGRTDFLDRGRSMPSRSARDVSSPAFARPDVESSPGDGVPVLELGVEYSYLRLSAGDAGAQGCNGGGATAVWNVNRVLGLVADIGGCKMMSAGHNVSGDSTHYLFGPRIAFRNEGRVMPYLQVLVGGDKLTTETIYPEREPTAPIDVIANSSAADSIHSLYTSHRETNNFSWQVGGGMEYTLTSAIGWTLAEVDYLHVGARAFNDANFHNNLRFSTGVVLRIGGW
jgi:opacity protein-like surface antigen